VLRHATLLMILAAQAIRAASSTCPVVDLMPAFLDAVERTSGAPDAEQVKAFREAVVAGHPALYGESIVHVRTAEQVDRLAARAMSDARTHADRIRSIGAALTNGFPAYLERFQRVFSDFRCDFPIYLMPSLGQFDGAGRIVDGQPALVFGVDMIAEFHPASELELIVDHELFHRYHAQVAGMSDDKEEKDIVWRLLWAEGLATYASWALNPRLSLQDVLVLPKDLADRARPQLPQIAADLKSGLDQVSPSMHARYFSYSNRSTGVPPRTGYYVGCLLADRLAHAHTLYDLAHLQGPGLLAEIERALDELGRNPDTLPQGSDRFKAPRLAAAPAHGRAP
jgi:hypothetical protein